MAPQDHKNIGQAGIIELRNLLMVFMLVPDFAIISRKSIQILL
jgi:hypothetical protein